MMLRLILKGVHLVCSRFSAFYQSPFRLYRCYFAVIRAWSDALSKERVRVDNYF